MNFGNNLKALRTSNKMSQEVLAEKIGVTRQSVSKWEVGEAYPEMSNIVALCKIFHCQITDLINDNMIDTDKFDKDTQEGLTKFKKNQQKFMKCLSKTIYISTRALELFILIPTTILILIAIILPFMSNKINITENSIKFFDTEYKYSINGNILSIDGEEKYIDSRTNVEKFLKEHDSKYLLNCIEYVLISFSIIMLLLVYLLNCLYKLYKNINKEDTPFSVQNEILLKKGIIAFIVQMALTKVTALIFQIVTKVDLSLDFSLQDIIYILVILSIIYIFKYGRMIQVDSKAKIYDN